MRLERAEFEILQHLRLIPEFQNHSCVVHLMLSGGKDSVALFQALVRLRASPGHWSNISFSLVVHHFNHKRRGEESDADEAHCIDLALRQGCPIRVWRWTKELETQVLEGENFHSVARDWRYRSVRDFAHSFGEANQIPSWMFATAHHRRDHAETVIHNLARGCGKSGLLGLAPWSSETRCLRPLLWLPSELCDQYIKFKEWPHREDSSNSQHAYTRNRIRHTVLEELQTINIKAIEHIWSLSNDLRHEPETASEQLPQTSKSPETSVTVALTAIQSENDLHMFIAENLPHGRVSLSRRGLSNIFRHIRKCLNAPQVVRQYKFALSDSVCINLTNKHVEIKVTSTEFQKSPKPHLSQL